ncbi:MAG: GtrA family protein [bacterium]|nr:GtrA family protein [bacterium]
MNRKMIKHLHQIKLDRQFFVHLVKYGFVGAFNAVFTFIIYFVLLKIVGLHYLLSFSISWASGVLATYVINFKWVFKPEDKLVFKSRLMKYFIVYITSYVINMALLGTITESTGWDPLLAQFLIIPLVVSINFFGIKYWSMRPYEKKS